MSHLSLIKSFLGYGKHLVFSIDPGINFTGICTSEIDIRNSTFKIKEIYTYKTRSEDQVSKIKEVGGHIKNKIEESAFSTILIEEPTSSLVYGKGNRSYIVKRADNVCTVRCLIYYIMGVTYNIKNKYRKKIPIITIQPNQWQDKNESKKFKDSKEWSINKARRIISNLKFDRQNEVIQLLDEHNADALCMSYIITKKAAGKQGT